MTISHNLFQVHQLVKARMLSKSICLFSIFPTSPHFHSFLAFHTSCFYSLSLHCHNSLLPCFDAALGIVHSSPHSAEFMKSMRTFMPPNHRAYVIFFVFFFFCALALSLSLSLSLSVLLFMYPSSQSASILCE
jgi:hypothetical protein